MVIRIFSCACLAFCSAGCVLAPTEQSRSWTDDVMVETQGEAAPDYIPERTLSGWDVRLLEEGEAAARSDAESGRETGQALRALDETAEAYAAEARERGRPPE